MTEPDSIKPHTSIRHRWRDPDRFEHHSERRCEFCSLIKITMHPPRGNPWREWRYNSGKNFKSDVTPRCDPSGEVAAL